MSFQFMPIDALLANVNVTLVHQQKDVGNDAYEKQNYPLALAAYTKGIDYFQNTSESKEEWIPTNSHSLSEERNLLASLLSNRSATLLKLQEYQKACTDANHAIRIRPDWVKGYFRRAEALWNLKEFKAALVDYEKAYQLDITDDYILYKIDCTRVKIREMDQGIQIHQLLSGREICQKTWFNLVANMIYDYAVQMMNFIYLISDAKSKECFVVDICWDVDGVLNYAKKKGLKIVGAIVTHFHFDHVGGIPPPPFDSYRIKVNGLATLLNKLPHIKAYIHPLDIDEVLKSNPDISIDRIVPTVDGTTVSLPLNSQDSLQSLTFEFLHTPGHTPGSQSILINKTSLLPGDTLFVGSCGRMDFPESNARQMWNSISFLSQLDPSIGVYPGHCYNGDMTTIGTEKKKGVLQYKNELDFFGACKK